MALKFALVLLAVAAVATALTESEQEALDKLLAKQKADAHAKEQRVKRAKAEVPQLKTVQGDLLLASRGA